MQRKLTKSLLNEQHPEFPFYPQCTPWRRCNHITVSYKWFMAQWLTSLISISDSIKITNLNESLCIMSWNPPKALTLRNILRLNLPSLHSRITSKGITSIFPLCFWAKISKYACSTWTKKTNKNQYQSATSY